MDRFSSLRQSEDGDLYVKKFKSTGKFELRWKDQHGNIFVNPTAQILPISLGGRRDPKKFKLRLGANDWEVVWSDSPIFKTLSPLEIVLNKTRDENYVEKELLKFPKRHWEK